jgi:hypothetical protein
VTLALRFYDTSGKLVSRFGEPAEIVFSTKLPGGCWELSATVVGAQTERWVELDEQTMTRCELTDAGGQVIWSGRLARPVIREDQSRLVCEGWGLSMWDNPVTLTVAPTVYAHGVIYQLLQACPLLSQDTALIVTTNTTDLGNGGQVIYDFQRPGDILTNLVKIGSAAGAPHYARVGADKRLEYFARPTAIHWTTTMADIWSEWEFEADRSAMYSAVVVEYTDLAGTRQRSRPYSREDTAQKLGYSRTGVYALPREFRTWEGAGSSPVRNIALAWLETRSRPTLRSSDMVIKGGVVRDPRGIEWPSYYVKAGEVVQIVDLPPYVAGYSQIFDDRRTFLAIATEYDAETRELKVTPENAPETVEVMVAGLMTEVNRLAR